MSEENHRSTSEVLLALVRTFPGERMRLQDVIDGLGERSFGFLLLLFGVACAIAPPGFATITSIPLMIFGLQMLARYRTPWLPRSIAARSFLCKFILDNLFISSRYAVERISSLRARHSD